MSEQNIVYPLRDVLDRIERKVDNIDVKMALKADRESMHVLLNRVAALELTVASRQVVLDQLREALADIAMLKAWRNRAIGAAGLALALGFTAFLKAFGFD